MANIPFLNNAYFAAKVGIGTDSPNYKLAVYGSTSDSKIVASFGSANAQNEYTAIGLSGFIASNGATKAGLALKRTGTYGTGELHFLNNNTIDNSDMTLSDSKMMITPTGNVGIGTTLPSTLLQVNGTGITTAINDGAYTAGYFARLSSLFGPQALKLTSRCGDILRGSDYGASVTILTGGTTSASVFISSGKAVQFNGYSSTNFVGTPTFLLGTDASGNIVKTNTIPGSAAGPYLPLAGGTMAGTITMNNNRITSIEELRFNNGGNIGNQINTDVDTGTETVASVAIATYTAAFFDFVVKKTTNVRSGTVYACHDGTSVVFTETSTNDLGDTSDVTLSVDISGTNMRLLATVTSDDWSVKSLIRAI